jgi:hypothetical protein
METILLSGFEFPGTNIEIAVARLRTRFDVKRPFIHGDNAGFFRKEPLGFFA